MADREFVFSDPAVQRLIREKFIPLAMDDWYLRRQNDAQGKFFMEMTRESPRGNVGEGTRQGRYVFTAGGKFLGFNNNRSPERLLAMLRETLGRWEKLPAADRAVPGDLGDVVREARYERRVPAGGKGGLPPMEEIVAGELRLCPDNRTAVLGDRPLVLTPVEFDLLVSLARARGRVRTRDRLLEEIRDRHYEVFDRSIDVHISALRKKLGDDPKHPKFIRTLRGAGYMLTDSVS